MPGDHSVDGPEGIAALLARLRHARGLSQLRLAERLCTISGMPTVSRHEVSRWERGERIPGPFWLGWLSVALGVPLERLEAAVAASRTYQHHHRPSPADHRRLWQPPTAAEISAELDDAPTHDLPGLAHAWLTGPPEATPHRSSASIRRTPDAGTTNRDEIERLAGRLAVLRRYDDLIGGSDLAPHVDRELRAAVEALRSIGGGQDQRLLAVVAGYAQLAGWVHSDAANNPAARRAYQAGLRAAAAAGDRPLAAHILGSLSHHCLSDGDPYEALLLARTGHAGIKNHGSRLLRALLLHRVALAAAWVGERRVAWRALRLAAHTADQVIRSNEPAWLYWLDHGELTAMTGRCLVLLGRPTRAIQLLAAHVSTTGPRSAAIYGAWLARAYTATGEAEHANTATRQTRQSAVASGSERAAKAARRHARAKTYDAQERRG